MRWFMGSQRVGHDWATELNWTEPGFETSLHMAFASFFLYHHHVTASDSLRHASEAFWLNSEQIKSYSVHLLIILPIYFCDAQPRLERQWTQILAVATFVNSNSSFNTLGQNWCTFSPCCGLPKERIMLSAPWCSLTATATDDSSGISPDRRRGICWSVHGAWESYIWGLNISNEC